MAPGVKILAGFAATAFVVWASLMPFGGAGAVADDLGQRTETALGNAGAADVSVRVPGQPVRREIHLSGDYPNALRLRAVEIALAQPGVARAVWDVEADETGAADAQAQPCVDRIAAVTEGERIGFRSGSPYINPEAARLLDRIAEAARGCEGATIAITGHSDSGGDPNVNREMAAFRATAVRDALAERGVPMAMMTTAGRGTDEPIGDDPADPANRRVEFAVSAAGGEAS